MTRIRGVKVREGLRQDWAAARDLAWRVYEEYNAADDAPEGKETFRRFLYDGQLYSLYTMGGYRLFVATLYGHVVGMLGMRERAHISLLFVDGRCHGNGIGGALVEYAAETVAQEHRGEALSVHATPSAVRFYERLGFEHCGKEQESQGVRYVPMLLRLE